jgi:UDP-sugar transporter A1/2/3
MVNFATHGTAFWQGILTTVSQTSGGYKYDYATVPFLGELLKVRGYCCTFFFQKKQEFGFVLLFFSMLMEVWMYACPFCIRLLHRLFFLVANLSTWSYM